MADLLFHIGSAYSVTTESRCMFFVCSQNWPLNFMQKNSLQAVS